MRDDPTIRAWKDADFRLTLPSHDGVIPESPAGAIELDDVDLGAVAGGYVDPLTQGTICGTGLACFTAITIAVSKNISCGACDTTLWSGTCYVSSVGCCPNP